MAGYGDVTQRPPAACPNQKMLYEFGQQPVLRQARSQSALPAGHPVGVGGEATTAIKTVPYFVTVWQVGQKYTFPPRYACRITLCGWITRKEGEFMRRGIRLHLDNGFADNTIRQLASDNFGFRYFKHLSPPGKLLNGIRNRK